MVINVNTTTMNGWHQRERLFIINPWNNNQYVSIISIVSFIFVKKKVPLIVYFVGLRSMEHNFYFSSSFFLLFIQFFFFPFLLSLLFLITYETERANIERRFAFVTFHRSRTRLRLL